MASQRAPALELPYELTAKIFRSCLPLHGRVRPSPTCAPLQLVQICRHWRSVAMDTPELWSSVDLSFPEDRYDGIRKLFEPSNAPPARHPRCDLLEMWFGRSAQYPLSITISCQKTRNVPEGLFSILAAHTSHWGRVEMAVTLENLTEFNKIPGPFPLLRSLAVCLTDRYSPIPFMNVLRYSPNLQAVNFSESFPPITPKDFRNNEIPHSLTALQTINLIPDAPLDDFVRSLKQCVHVGIRVDFSRSSTRQWSTSIPRVLPNLKSLVLPGHVVLLNVLTIPTLQHLEVAVFGRLPFEPLTNFLRRSTCRLSHLTIDFIQIPKNDDLAAGLAAVPTLESLQLWFRDPDPDLDYITTRYQVLERTDLLPRLRALLINDALLGDVTYGEFLAVLRARSLQHAELNMRPETTEGRVPPPDSEMIGEYRKLAAHGMSVHLTTPDFGWPAYTDGEDTWGDLEYDVFGSGKARPHSFSPYR